MNDLETVTYAVDEAWQRWKADPTEANWRPMNLLLRHGRTSAPDAVWVDRPTRMALRLRVPSEPNRPEQGNNKQLSDGSLWLLSFNNCVAP